jgi:hypothetical protein
MQEILYVSSMNCVPEVEAWRFLTNLILKSRELPDQAKLLLLERLPRMAAETPAHFQSLSAAERSQVKRWLKKYMVKVLPGEARQLRLQELGERLAEPADRSG